MVPFNFARPGAPKIQPFGNGSQEPAVPDDIFGGAQEPAVPDMALRFEQGENPWPNLGQDADWFQTQGGGSGGSPWDALTGGGGFQDILQRILGLGQTGGTSALTLPMLLSALSQWKDADRYMDYGREAAGMASPITNDDRRRSLEMYRQWETDPNKFLESNPVYQGALRQGLNAAERSQAAQGNLGSGEMLMALQQVGQDTAGRFIQEELRRLREDAGFQFNPAQAAELFMRGVQGSIDARNGALGSLGFGLQNLAQGGQRVGNQPQGPGGSGSGGGAGGGGAGGSGVNFNPGQIANIAQRLGMSPQQLFPILGQFSQWGIQPQTALSLLQQGLPQSLGWDINDPDSWNFEDLENSPIFGPPLIDDGGGGGGFGPVNPWEQGLPGGWEETGGNWDLPEEWFGEDGELDWDYFDEYFFDDLWGD